MVYWGTFKESILVESTILQVYLYLIVMIVMFTLLNGTYIGIVVLFSWQMFPEQVAETIFHEYTNVCVCMCLYKQLRRSHKCDI